MIRRRRPAITANTNRYGVSGDVATVTATVDIVTITTSRAADYRGVSDDGAGGA